MYFKQLFVALRIFVVFTILTGFLYPLMITIIAQKFFPWQANGSLILKNGKIIGSHLIGQQFDDPKYFWSRLSATSAMSFDASASCGSNFGPSNPALVQAAQKRINALKLADPLNNQTIPVDLVTSSGSGLDPHITPEAALYQVKRISRIRGLSEVQIKNLIQHHTQDRFLGLLGEPAVNVLELNLSLDELK